MRCPSCGFESLPGMSFCGMCGTRLAVICPSCSFANPPDYRFCGACGQPLIEEAASQSPAAVPVRRQGKGPAVVPSGLSLGLVAFAESDQAFGQAALGAAPKVAEPQVEDVQLWGERRTATVILADVRGSTDLLERMGTEAWVAMMNRVFHLLESEIYRYGGIVDQFRGDGLVAFFGTRGAHEDDPERAALAALAMQAAVGDYASDLGAADDLELKLRVGINTGEVIVANIGDRARHSEDTAMGEAIALAARMEQAAEPGTVLVSDNTYHLIEDQFRWQSLGEIEVKGIARPVAVYRPLEPRPVALRSLRLESLGLSPVLVGREEERDAILERVQELRQRRGSIIFLTGDEGMGKSYLVSQVRQQVLRDDALLVETQGDGSDVRGVTWLRGHCRSYEQAWPYSMWIDLLENALGTQDLPAQAAAERLRSECERLWGSAAEEHLPYLAALLSLPMDPSLAEQVAQQDAEGVRQRSFGAVRGWVETMAREGPLVLAFDDVYWADSTSLQLLEHCLSVCDQRPVLFLIMFRARLESAIWAFQERVEQQYPHRLTTLALGPLSALESAEMIDELVGAGTLPEEARDRIVARAEGNPYYIEEIIRSLIRGRVLTQADGEGQWCVAREIEEVDLPDTLRSLLAARIDDLSMAERHTLQVAALVGNVFWRNVLEELVGSEVDLGACLTGLQRAQLVQERGQVTDLGMEYVFRSALLRELACESLLSRQRAVYARRAADYMARLFGGEVLTRYYDVVARLYHVADERRRELFYTLSAAEHAQDIYANEEALALYQRALELIDQVAEEGEEEGSRGLQDWRMESLKGVGSILLGKGEAGQAEPYLRQAVDLAEASGVSPRELARLYYWLCEALFWGARYEEQIEIAQRGLALVEGEGPSVEVALMNQEIAVGSLPLGREEVFREYTQRTAQFLEALPYSEELRPAYDHVATLYALHLGKPEVGLRWLRLLRDRAETHQDLRAVGQSHDYAGLVLKTTGDLCGAVEEYDQALELGERVGDTWQELDAVRHLADTYLALGRLEQARAYAERALEVMSRLGHLKGTAEVNWRIGQIACASGAYDEALERFGQAAEQFRVLGEMPVVAMMEYYTAAAQMHKGANAEALRQFIEATALAGPEVMAQNPTSLVLVLNAVEALSGGTGAFDSFCAEWQGKLPEDTLGQWALRPAETLPAEWPLLAGNTFNTALGTLWRWEDPLGGCAYRVAAGLTIEAANGRGLSGSNASAPRVVRQLVGEGACEVICSRGADALPAIGGLVLWRERRSYLALTWGFGGRGAFLFRGWVDGRDAIAGRGWLPDGADQAHLRLEWQDGAVRALCRADDVQWYQVGEARWDSSEPFLVGIHAIGDLDRITYPGRYAEGTAITFHDVRVWGTEPLDERSGGGQEPD
jgi:class 3 adenylate cyclase/predicted ATPase